MCMPVCVCVCASACVQVGWRGDGEVKMSPDDISFHKEAGRLILCGQLMAIKLSPWVEQEVVAVMPHDLHFLKVEGKVMPFCAFVPAKFLL